MNIDEIIAGPNPVAADRAPQALTPEAEAIYATMMATLAKGQDIKPRVHRRIFAGTGIFASAAAAVTLVATSLLSGGASPSIAGAAELQHLATQIQTTAVAPPTGDATLEIRTSVNPTGLSVSTTHLYADNGDYFVTPTESELPAAVAANDNIGNGFSAREIQAAIDAVSGNVAQATQAMADAAYGNGVAPAPTNSAIWDNAVQALIAGAGVPDVRTGVLRILATIPGIAITNTSTNGLPTLTLTASALTAPSDHQETVTLDASTGVPVSFTAGVVGQAPFLSFTLQVSRVFMANIEAGKF